MAYFSSEACDRCREVETRLESPKAKRLLDRLVEVRVNTDAGASEKEIADRSGVTEPPALYGHAYAAAPPEAIPLDRAVTPKELVAACRARIGLSR